MTNETKLEPCPFCKGSMMKMEMPDELEQQEYTCVGISVGCPVALSSVPFTLAQVNNRPIEADLRAKLETVSRALNKVRISFLGEVESDEDLQALYIAEQVLKGEK